jgi:hypothetical protein
MPDGSVVSNCASAARIPAAQTSTCRPSSSIAATNMAARPSCSAASEAGSLGPRVISAMSPSLSVAPSGPSRRAMASSRASVSISPVTSITNSPDAPVTSPARSFASAAWTACATAAAPRPNAMARS